MTETERGGQQISAALRERMRVGQGLSAPYARKWDVGGCAPGHSLWRYPHDSLESFSNGLVALRRPLDWSERGLQVGYGADALWVAINRSLRGEGPPDAYLVGRPGTDAALYIGNSPEVILEILDTWPKLVVGQAHSDELQIGFPVWRRGVRSTSVVGSGTSMVKRVMTTSFDAPRQRPWQPYARHAPEGAMQSFEAQGQQGFDRLRCLANALAAITRHARPWKSLIAKDASVALVEVAPRLPVVTQPRIVLHERCFHIAQQIQRVGASQCRVKQAGFRDTKIRLV